MYNSPLLQELEKKFKHKGDLPVLRDTAVKVMKITEDRVAGAPQLTRAILRDQGLTAKILKVANSIFYNPTDKEINTISKAVVLLGFDMIRSISFGLSFLEMFQKHYPHIDIKKIMAESFIAATQAMEIANVIHHPQPEEVFIAALLYRLGPMTVAYYLPEAYLKAQQLVTVSGLSTEEAEQKTLGFSFNQVGIAFAKEWGLPEGVVYALSPVNIGSSQVHSPIEQLQVIAHLSNKITQNLFTDERENDDMGRFVHNLQKCLAINQDEGIRLIEDSYKKATEVSRLFGIEVEKFKPAAALSKSNGGPPSLRDRLLDSLGKIFEGKAEKGKEDDKEDVEEDLNVSGNMEDCQPANNSDTQVSHALLQLKFLQEISMHIFGNQDINTLFNMILEGLNRGIGFDRSLLALCNHPKTRVAGRFALGIDSDNMANLIDLPINPTENIFGISFRELKPYIVQDIDSEEFRPYIPDIIRNEFKASAFVLSPIHAKGNVIGFFYADNAPSGRQITMEDFKSFIHFTLQANISLERLMIAAAK